MPHDLMSDGLKCFGAGAFYYDSAVACIWDAEAILVFGPGEANGELKKRLERNKLGGRIASIETVDKMTDRQIAAKVRQYFTEQSPATKSRWTHLTMWC